MAVGSKAKPVGQGGQRRHTNQSFGNTRLAGAESLLELAFSSL